VAAGAAATLFLILLLAAYSRFHRGRDVLANPTRRATLDAITASPGINLTRLANVVGVDRSTARHHSGTLARQGYVAIVRKPGETLYYRPDARPAGVASRTPTALERAMEALRSSPEGLSRDRIREVLHDVPERTRNGTIRRMIRRNLAVAIPVDGRTVLRLAAIGGPTAANETLAQPRFARATTS
jgi:DNA-binding transcriptional ArsR family regulator